MGQHADTPRPQPEIPETSALPLPPTLEKKERIRKRKCAKKQISKIPKKETANAVSETGNSGQDPPLVIDVKTPDDFALTNNDTDEEEEALLSFNPETA